ISTIYIRQGKNAEAMRMSRDVIKTLKDEDDRSGTLGLAYSIVGSLHEKAKRNDSAAIYCRIALQDFIKSKSYAYVPGAYIKAGEFENKRFYLEKSLGIADSTQNRQAQVSSLLALGKWDLNSGDNVRAEEYFRRANAIAALLTDKIFEIKSLEAL